MLLPSGVRVIDMQVGEGPLPAKGERVWCHFKAWPRGFRFATSVLTYLSTYCFARTAYLTTLVLRSSCFLLATYCVLLTPWVSGAARLRTRRS